MVHHNELRDRFADLTGKAFTPTRAHNNPLIFAGCAVKRTKEKPAISKAKSSTKKLETIEHKINLLIRDLWKNGTDSVHNIRVVNTDAKSHSEKTPEKCLHEVERENNKMYLESCLQ